MKKVSYQEFLKSKVKVKVDVGIDPDTVKIPDILKPHQKDSVKFCLKRGVALLAKSFGLGKTLDQAALTKIAHQVTGKKTLQIIPLGVRQEFTHKPTGSANRVYPSDIDVNYEYCTSDIEIRESKSPYVITNYERVRDGNIDPRKHDFCIVCMDEASIIGNLGTKTYAQFEVLLKDIPLKIIATATPSPNDFRQLIYYANMLGVRDNSASLTRWFGRDVNKAGNLQLLPQFEEEFWLWVSTWALFLYKPSDLGYSDNGYKLPELKIFWHRLPVDHKKAWNETDNRGQFCMLSMLDGSITDMHRDKHRTLSQRMAKAVELVNSFEDIKEHNGILLWHNYEYERKEIEKQLKGHDLQTVYGSQSLEKREQAIINFQDGKYRILATKPVIAGSGCNFQHRAHRNIFLSANYKFKDFIQSVHRTYRFMQSYPVEIHIIYSESEDHIINTLRKKWENHDKLTRKMQSIVKEYGLSTEKIVGNLERTLGIKREATEETLYTAVNNDNVKETQQMETNSIDLIITSVPFDNHYEYTESVEDFSFNDNDFERPLSSGFWEQMNYLTPELLRILKPGRKCCVHVKDRILYSYQVQHGLTSVFPFSDEAVMHFIKHGFVYEGRRTIVTDVVRENNSTYRLGYTEMSKDATKMGSGLPEYVLTFRKPNTDSSKQYSDERVTKFKSLKESDRDQNGNHVCVNQDTGEKTRYNLRQMIQCGNCGFEGKESDLIFVEGDNLYKKYRCPQCGKTQIVYTRAQWQLDASPFWQSSGNALVTKDFYDFSKHWEKMHDMDLKGNLSASFLQEPPESKSDMVWDDIVFMRCLNSEQSRKRTTNHICPLPLDIVERLIMLYSDIGDLILDPFAGLFTVPYCAINLGRKGYGIELNSNYYKDGKEYCDKAEQKKLAPTLFDVLEQMEKK